MNSRMYMNLMDQLRSIERVLETIAEQQRELSKIARGGSIPVADISSQTASMPPVHKAVGSPFVDALPELKEGLKE